MNELKETYLKIYEPVMEQIGFVRKGTIFHRITNGKVIQMLSYMKFSYSFTIQFDISPLCAGNEYRMYMDEKRIGMLLGNETYAEWDFNEADINDQLQESLEICKTHLFPLFNNICNYDTYYNYVIENHNKMLAMLNDSYKTNNAIYISTPNDVGIYEICLSQGNYNLAKKLQEAHLKIIESAIKRNQECGIEPSQKKLERIKTINNDYMIMNKAMDINDSEFIKACVKEKEEYSLESYIKNFWGKKALKAYKNYQQIPWYISSIMVP